MPTETYKDHPYNPKPFDLAYLGTFAAYEDVLTSAPGDGIFEGNYTPPSNWHLSLNDEVETFLQSPDSSRPDWNDWVFPRMTAAFSDWEELYPADTSQNERDVAREVGFAQFAAAELSKLRSDPKPPDAETKELIRQLEVLFDKSREKALNDMERLGDGKEEWLKTMDEGIEHNRKINERWIPDLTLGAVKDPKVKAPSSKPARGDMRELRDSLPPGVSVGASGYRDHYSG